MIRAALVLALAVAALYAVGRGAVPEPAERGGVAALLTETDPPAGFAYALEPRPFRFPADHGAHPDYRSEWWYFTGNVEDGERAFGFQVTVFRFALRAGAAAAGSPWRSHQVYLGHVALSDLDRGRFYSAERRARPALGQAGVDSDPVTIRIQDWRIERRGGADETWRLRAVADTFSLDLKLDATRPVIAQGERGLSRKSAEPGNASYYYSIPRFDVRGEIGTGAERHVVSGDAWFDHEWSTSALAADQIGWDWFALQLDDGRDLMFYQIRNQGGRPDPASHGVIINADGTTESLSPAQIALTVTRYWRSRASGARYPAGWQIRIPDHALELRVQPRMAAQEWHRNFTYWEGAVSAEGSAGGLPVNGRGYVELVGYDTTR